MIADTVTGILQTISNPIRSFLIQSLKDNSMVFSDLMRVCGLNPNSDTGTFSYHLSVLMDSTIIIRKDNEYQLTNFGHNIADFINSLQRESDFLLKGVKLNKGGEIMTEIESRWLGQSDLYGQYSLIMGPQLETTPMRSGKGQRTMFSIGGRGNCLNSTYLPLASSAMSWGSRRVASS